MFKIATLADWFGKGPLEGIRESRRCGAQGVQLYAWNELNPFTIGGGMIQDLRATARENGQAITALCGELSEVAPGGEGLEVAAENPPKVEYLKKVMDLAVELECPVVTTHIGIVPEEESGPRYEALLESCGRLGQYARKLGVCLAIETGPEPIPRLCRFVDRCGGGVAINYDPANLVMVTAEDEVQGVYTAGGRIVHTHAKDGVLRQYAGPEKIYRIFAQGGIEALAQLPDFFAETPLGQGSVRWLPYLTALKDVGYDGYLTIEREVSQDAAADILLAVRFLQDALAQLNQERSKSP
ncbi:MAG: sugar phosphate isomerase/epimerase [Candidatus Limiplasma sp.]|nr:sugar phosphate isomerase/epimerase [Candidatus Limiplasma sp.]